MSLAASEAPAIFAAVVSILGALGVFLGMYLSRRSEHETFQLHDEGNEFAILRGTVQTLQEETNRLSKSLADANDQAISLNHELSAAQENVRILSAHIRRYVPELPFPQLRVMNEL